MTSQTLSQLTEFINGPGALLMGIDLLYKIFIPLIWIIWILAGMFFIARNALKPDKNAQDVDQWKKIKKNLLYGLITVLVITAVLPTIGEIIKTQFVWPWVDKFATTTSASSNSSILINNAGSYTWQTTLLSNQSSSTQTNTQINVNSFYKLVKIAPDFAKNNFDLSTLKSFYSSYIGG